MRALISLAIPLAAALAACNDDDSSRRMETATAEAPVDAGLPPKPAEPPPEPPVPAAVIGDYHLDSTSSSWKPRREKAGTERTLRLILRSSPPGAMAHVDGVPIGVTPTYWEGAATGKPKNFVFTLRGYSMARYRFVPVTDGVVHGRLKKLAVVTPDAGVDEAAPPAAPEK